MRGGQNGHDRLPATYRCKIVILGAASDRIRPGPPAGGDGAGRVRTRLGIIIPGISLRPWGEKMRHWTKPRFCQKKFHRSRHHSQAVFDAPGKIDGRGFREIAGGTGNLADGKAEVNGLGQHLVVEDKIVGVLPQGESLQDFPGKGPETRVIFGEFGAQKQVLEQGEHPVE